MLNKLVMNEYISLSKVSELVGKCKETLIGVHKERGTKNNFLTENRVKLDILIEDKVMSKYEMKRRLMKDVEVLFSLSYLTKLYILNKYIN
jgi:hypothetical protein